MSLCFSILMACWLKSRNLRAGVNFRVVVGDHVQDRPEKRMAWFIFYAFQSYSSRFNLFELCDGVQILNYNL